jgi:hypothetical protein
MFCACAVSASETYGVGDNDGDGDGGREKCRWEKTREYKKDQEKTRKSKK